MITKNLAKFICDRCGNTAPFRHGMTTWSLDYSDLSKDGRSFCSEICVKEIYLQEKAAIGRALANFLFSGNKLPSREEMGA